MDHVIVGYVAHRLQTHCVRPANVGKQCVAPMSGGEGIKGYRVRKSLGAPPGWGVGGEVAHPRWRLHANETSLACSHRCVCVCVRLCVCVCVSESARREKGEGDAQAVCAFAKQGQRGARALQNFWEGIEPETDEVKASLVRGDLDPDPPRSPTPLQ